MASMTRRMRRTNTKRKWKMSKEDDKKNTRKLYYYTTPADLAEPIARKEGDDLSGWCHVYRYLIRRFIPVSTEEEWDIREALDTMFLDTKAGDSHEMLFAEREALVTAINQVRSRMDPDLDLQLNDHWRAAICASTKRPKRRDTDPAPAPESEAS